MTSGHKSRAFLLSTVKNERLNMDMPGIPLDELKAIGLKNGWVQNPETGHTPVAVD